MPHALADRKRFFWAFSVRNVDARSWSRFQTVVGTLSLTAATRWLTAPRARRRSAPSAG